MQDIEKLLGSVIAKRRQAAGLTQEELAHSAEIHRTYISQIERGLKSPTARILFSIADVLGQKLSSILKSVEDEL